ncbi:MAG: LysR family transcriptional regulator [Pseudomonadales bacterium]|nr:LysR family transcriptional regulator [Pseudomonadales bacterium]
MNIKLPRISLEQWLAFKTVVDAGSYVQAAEQLNKSQSSVSYAIQRLNELLPQPVLAINGRKAELTEAGKVLYRHADELINQACQAEDVARSMASGFESEVILGLDVLVEINDLVCVFEEFSQEFPLTRIRVLETSLSGTTEAILEQQADLVITGAVPTGYSGTPLRQIEMVPVAAPEHPLVLAGEVSDLELRSHRQVVMRDTGRKREQDVGWLGSQQRWTVSHFSSSIKLLKSGLVFAFMPRNWIQENLDREELHIINLSEGASRFIHTYLIYTKGSAAGPASKALGQRIVAELRAETTV